MTTQKLIKNVLRAIVINVHIHEAVVKQSVFVKSGWRPGAISKRLLRALNEAKLRRSVVEEKRAKKTKKRIEAKPTLIISSKGGEYRIDVNVQPNSKDEVECTPLIYRIEAANNKAKMKKKEKKQRRLIRAAVNSTWSDPYHPENCENICLPAYKRAIGLNDQAIIDCEGDDASSDSSSSADEESISSCSSSDIDWQLQYSPPFTTFRKQIVTDTV